MRFPNRTGLECLINSKIYYSFRFSPCLSDVSGFGDPSYRRTRCPYVIAQFIACANPSLLEYHHLPRGGIIACGELVKIDAASN